MKSCSLFPLKMCWPKCQEQLRWLSWGDEPQWQGHASPGNIFERISSGSPFLRADAALSKQSSQLGERDRHSYPQPAGTRPCHGGSQSPGWKRRSSCWNSRSLVTKATFTQVCGTTDLRPPHLPLQADRRNPKDVSFQHQAHTLLRCSINAGEIYQMNS